MSKISGIIITKNEENTIVDCIDSISFCSEVIVIDAGSSDRTVDVAKRMGAKVFIHETKDFSKLRNYGLEKASEDWIFYIDSDERASIELAKNIENKIRGDLNIDVYKILRKNFYLGNNEWPRIEKIERLFKRRAIKKWQGQLHESPVYTGEVGEIDGFLFHYTHRNLSSMLEKTIEWSKIEAELRFEANHPKMTWWRFPRVMVGAFLKSYFIEGGWRVGTAGLIESIYQAFSIFITYARLWELQQEILKSKNEYKD